MLKFKCQNSNDKINSNSKSQISKLKLFHLFIIFAFSFLILISGCASLNEGIKSFLGVSTKELELARKNAITKTVNYDYFSCYTKTYDILKEKGSYIYSQDINKHIIAVYLSEKDTTPVGIFFKEIDSKNTQIEIASPSTYAKELIAARLFSGLEK